MDEHDRIKYALREVDANEAFIMKNGIKLYSLEDLADALRIISDDIYNYHVTHERNDFATWVRDVFNDLTLAARLYAAKNRFDAADKVEERIEFLRKRLEYKEQVKENKQFKKIWVYDFLIGFILGIIFAWFLSLIL